MHKCYQVKKECHRRGADACMWGILRLHEIVRLRDIAAIDYQILPASLFLNSREILRLKPGADALPGTTNRFSLREEAR